MGPSVFGYGIASELPLERVSDGPAARGRLRLVRARRSLLDARGELVSWQEAETGPQWLALARSRDGLVGACSETGAFLIEPEAARVQAEPRNGTDELWQHRMTATAIPLLAAELGDLVLHASAIVLPAGAVLFCGPSGRGKSTLALALSRGGHPVLGEDGVAVTFDDEGRPVAWPGPHGIRLADVAGAVKRVRAVASDLRVTAPAPVLAVVALAPRTPGELTVERLDAVTGARALVSSAMCAPGAGFARAFSLIARLAERVPVWRACMPDDLEAADFAARDLVEQSAVQA